MWEGSDIIFPDRVGYFFVYTSWKLGSSLSCKLPIYIYIYIYMCVCICICVCVGQRGGGHSRITEYAGHIIHQSTWHTDKIWRNYDTRLYCDKRCQYESTMGTRCSCSAYAPLLCCFGAHACGVKRASVLGASWIDIIQCLAYLILFEMQCFFREEPYSFPVNIVKIIVPVKCI